MSDFAIGYSMKKKKMNKGGMPCAEGGMIDDDDGADMVERILKRHYSEGGMIANGGDDDPEKMAGSKPNNFDDLALRDDLEFSYTGENSGDMLGNDQEDKDRDDIVARAYASWKKKDRNPRPA